MAEHEFQTILDLSQRYLIISLRCVEINLEDILEITENLKCESCPVDIEISFESLDNIEIAAIGDLIKKLGNKIKKIGLDIKNLNDIGIAIFSEAINKIGNITELELINGGFNANDLSNIQKLLSHSNFEYTTLDISCVAPENLDLIGKFTDLTNLSIGMNVCHGHSFGDSHASAEWLEAFFKLKEKHSFKTRDIQIKRAMQSGPAGDLKYLAEKIHNNYLKQKVIKTDENLEDVSKFNATFSAILDNLDEDGHFKTAFYEFYENYKEMKLLAEETECVE